MGTRVDLILTYKDLEQYPNLTNKDLDENVYHFVVKTDGPKIIEDLWNWHKDTKIPFHQVLKLVNWYEKNNPESGRFFHNDSFLEGHGVLIFPHAQTWEILFYIPTDDCINCQVFWKSKIDDLTDKSVEEITQKLKKLYWG